MNRQLSSIPKEEIKPLYWLIWQRLKYFPQTLAAGSQNPPKLSGPAAAALISGGFGAFLMMVTHHLADTSKDLEKIVWQIGSWMPGSYHPSLMEGHIGSYSGKETMLLVGWLVSWLILHLIWRNKNIKSRTIFFWMFLFYIAATVMIWHPLFPYLPLMSKP